MSHHDGGASAGPGVTRDPGELSLTLGGPLYQLLLRARVLRPPMDLLARRIVAVVALAWVPLLILAALQGDLVGNSVRVPFLMDISVHTRLLVALPLLIACELVVHRNLGPNFQQFATQGLVRPEDRPRFDAIKASTMRWRDSIPVELVLLAVALTAGHIIWRGELVLTVDTWYAHLVGGNKSFTPAGLWYAFVSVPFLQFVALRWYYRLALWARALWLVSRLDLHLIPSHPDRCGGLGFLGKATYAFSLLLFAQGALVSGAVASRIFFDGQLLLAFRSEIAALVVLLLLVVLAPLFVFTPALLQAKRRGILEYSRLGTAYTREFERKWIRSDDPRDETQKESHKEQLIGSADIQSLADLASSFEVVEGMRPVPFGAGAVISLALAAALPLLPLVLTMIPLEEVMARLVKVLL